MSRKQPTPPPPNCIKPDPPPAPPTARDRERCGATLIAAERARQIKAEGWTAEHDDQHADGELLAAADCYLSWASDYDPMRTYGPMPDWWPWEPKWWRPSDDPIRNLEKAGALIAAEIDRLLRLKQAT